MGGGWDNGGYTPPFADFNELYIPYLIRFVLLD
jgi:hypothetical protein